MNYEWSTIGKHIKHLRYGLAAYWDGDGWCGMIRPLFAENVFTHDQLVLEHGNEPFTLSLRNMDEYGGHPLLCVMELGWLARCSPAFLSQFVLSSLMDHVNHYQYPQSLNIYCIVVIVLFRVMGSSPFSLFSALRRMTPTSCWNDVISLSYWD